MWFIGYPFTQELLANYLQVILVLFLRSFAREGMWRRGRKKGREERAEEGEENGGCEEQEEESNEGEEEQEDGSGGGRGRCMTALTKRLHSISRQHVVALAPDLRPVTDAVHLQDTFQVFLRINEECLLQKQK